MQLDACFNLAMRKSSRLITHFYEERLAPLGIKVGQFSILRAVFLLKETNNKQLQSVLVLDQTTLSRSIKPLIRDGYIQVVENEKDRRVKTISLTSQGEAFYLQAHPIWEQAQKDFLEKIGTSQVNNILNLSDKLLEKISY